MSFLLGLALPVVDPPFTFEKFRSAVFTFAAAAASRL
jgi:hypothetical protein